MVDAYRELLQRATDWFERAAAAHWFDDSDRRCFAAVERATPADLFAEGPLRPLVVALFGGTGVGKSSLLNRLAGSPIARVGVERPTSRDLTVHVHESVELADLPPELPLDRVQTRRHNCPERREVLWIDAPDIDSTEEANRQCALAWLPHVDLLCYVVSPERYRDDAGWRVLRERGYKHGWMFVMNRWDAGDLQQRHDFLRMLRAAGFDDPLLLHTCCADVPEPLPSPDEFEQIHTTIRELCDVHAVSELTRLGHRARLQELRGALENLQRRFGDGPQWEQLGDLLNRRWQPTRAQLLEGAAWAMQSVAARFAVREGGLVKLLGQQLGQVRGDRPGKEPEADPDAAELAALTATLWDDWSQSKVEGCLTTVEIQAARNELATLPLRRRLDQAGRRAREVVTEHVQDRVRAALVRPGGLLARLGRRVTGFLVAALPAAAIAAVGYKVVVGYYRATAGPEEFLGTEFAIHSALLVLVAWALPFLLDRMLRPSLERTVLRATQEGFGSGLDEVAADLEQALGDADDEAQRYRQEGQTLLKDAAGVMIKPVDPRRGSLSRLMAARAGQSPPARET